MEDENSVDSLMMVESMLELNEKKKLLETSGFKNIYEFLFTDEDEGLFNMRSKAENTDYMEKMVKYFANGIESGEAIFNSDVENIHLFSTGFEELDQIIGGGIYSNSITELIGSTGAGKTLLCYHVIANTIAKTSDDVMIIDSGSSFSHPRMRYFLSCGTGVEKLSDDDYFELRKRFIFDTAFNAEDLLTSLLVLLESLRTVSNFCDMKNKLNHHYKGKLKKKIRLVIIDNFSSMILINQVLLEYNLIVEEIVKTMNILRLKYFVGFLVTSSPKASQVDYERPKSILSTPWSFNVSMTLYLEKIAESQKNEYKAMLVYSEMNDNTNMVTLRMQN